MYKYPIIITIIYCLIYYGFLLNIARTRISLHKKYKEEGNKFDRYFGQDRNMLAADRIQLNMLEQMPIFLVLFWLNAVFVPGQWSSILGGTYTLTRAIYPFLIGNRMGRDIPMRILFATFSGYFLIIVFMVRLIIYL